MQKASAERKCKNKGNHKCANKTNAKTQCKTHRKIKNIYLASSKTQIAENVFGHPFDSHLGGVQDMQSRLPGFHAFRFLNLPHIQYVQA